MQPFHFIQLADPQLGMFASLSGKSEEEIAEFRRAGLKVRPAPKIEGFERETELFEEAISEANRLRPDFVVTCGDMVDDRTDQAQFDEVLRIAGMLDPDIPMYWLPGNHDVGGGTEAPTPETLARYREVFGPDYYAFQHRDVSFIVMNTAVLHLPEHTAEEMQAQLAFLEAGLEAASKRGSAHIIVFSHHALFLGHPDEPDLPISQRFALTRKQRRVVLDMCRRHGVSHVFAGHWHKNNYAADGRLQVITSSAVGYPLGDDPSGYRVVRVFEDRIEHDYYAFGEGPEAVDLGAPLGG